MSKEEIWERQNREVKEMAAKKHTKKQLLALSKKHVKELCDFAGVKYIEKKK